MFLTWMSLAESKEGGMSGAPSSCKTRRGKKKEEICLPHPMTLIASMTVSPVSILVLHTEMHTRKFAGSLVYDVNQFKLNLRYFI